MRLVASCLLVLKIVWYCSHKGILGTLIPMYHSLIFFFIFWCSWKKSEKVSETSCGCFAHQLHWTHTSQDVVMSRYQPFTLPLALGSVPFIKAFEPCIVCELPPFQHNCCWVTVTGLRRLQRRWGFSQWCDVMVLLYVCLTDESHQTYWPHTLGRNVIW